VEASSHSKASQGEIMNRKAEAYSSVPELRQQLMQKWYQDEWPAQEDAPSKGLNFRIAEPIAHLRRLISPHLSRPARSSQPRGPRSELETQAAQ
jgi:hypothetical protein